MAFYSGIFDFFYSLGKHQTQEVVSNLTTTNPPTQVLKTKGIELTKSDLSDLNKQEKELQATLQKQMRSRGQKKVKALLTEFYFQIRDKRETHKTLYDLRNNDVVKTIVEVLIDDGLTSSNDSKIFTIKYQDETLQDEIQTIIDDFVEKFKLDQTILDFIDEAIVLGEYILPIEHEKGIGITKIKDNPHMVNQVAVYDGQDKKGFLWYKSAKETEVLPKDYGIHFLLSYKKIRVAVKDFQNFTDQSTNIFLEDHIKIGQSLILPIINKLKQLEILEMANLALDLKRILAPVIAMVGMPENTQTDDIGAIVEEYEKVLGNMFKDLANVEGEIRLNDILSIAGDIKVLPSIGNNKGSITTLDLQNDNNSSSEKSESIRKSIALLLGIPFYYLSLMGENGMSRLESLKLFSRYSKKLNAMQHCIIEGVKELLCIHLEDLGKKIDPKDLDIKMRQITNVELLDSMEYLVTIVTALQDLLNVLQSVRELSNGKIEINYEKLLNVLNKLFKEFPECEELLSLKENMNNDDEMLSGNITSVAGLVNGKDNPIPSNKNKDRTNMSDDAQRHLNNIYEYMNKVKK